MKLLADALRATLISPNESDRNGEAANVVDGLFAIAVAIQNLASATQRLGNADAMTPMGAIEAFGLHIGEKIDRLADVIDMRNS